MLEIENLRPWETVEMVVKRHWIVFLWLIIYFFISVFLSVGIYVLFPNEWGILAVIVVWLASLMYIYIQWLNVELDLLVITNNRIIWVEQISFLNRTILEANLWQVQEVNSQTKGVLSNLLDFGTIIVKTAWDSSNFNMDFAPRAFANSRRILNIVDNYRDNYSWQDHVNADEKEGY